MKKSCSISNGKFIKFFCPGCKEIHVVGVKPDNQKGWEFNGDHESPTLSPSILIRTGHHVPRQKQPPDCEYCKEGDEGFCTICHSFVRDGMIQFLDDCTHDLKGKTVSLPEI